MQVTASAAPATNRTDTQLGLAQYALVLVLGVGFGLILTKSEAISWYRIQEMFRFQGFHMYGLLGSAVATGIISLALLKRLTKNSLFGNPLQLKPKVYHPGIVLGGMCFGFGWALTGACPGPIYALLGGGFWGYLPVLLSAIAGTWLYGRLRPYLPHGSIKV